MLASGIILAVFGFGLVWRSRFHRQDTNEEQQGIGEQQALKRRARLSRARESLFQ
jgi:hypothetical protein